MESMNARYRLTINGHVKGGIPIKNRIDPNDPQNEKVGSCATV
jgi:hypothetical protein